MKNNYWRDSTRPLACLAFIAPLLLIYEVGMVLMGPEALRNGADIWLRQILGQLGFGQYLFLPMLTCGLLLGWHHVTRQRWILNADVLSGMVLESIVFAAGLLLLAKLQSSLSGHFGAVPDATTAAIDTAPRLGRAVGYLGAGIYEELLFRVLIMWAATASFRAMGVDARSALVAAVFVTSILFAAAHYRLFFSVGDAFQWRGFFFRAIAGLFFSMLYLRRGFGITVGTHATYDLLVSGM